MKIHLHYIYTQLTPVRVSGASTGSCNCLCSIQVRKGQLQVTLVVKEGAAHTTQP